MKNLRPQRRNRVMILLDAQGDWLRMSAPTRVQAAHDGGIGYGGGGHPRHEGDNLHRLPVLTELVDHPATTINSIIKVRR